MGGVWKNPSGTEPGLEKRVHWDLARAACPLCDAGDFPLLEGSHPKGPCSAAHIHEEGPQSVSGPLVIDNLARWRPMTLAAILRKCDREYWVELGANGMTLSDTEYDRVMERLRELAPDHPQLEAAGFVTPDSWVEEAEQ